jgi:deoxyadenosine/deoxycytidine kinase
MMTSNRKTTPHIVVVGPCASGKTTLVELLQSRGYDAVVCGQEHSEIANLWQRTEPDALVALTVDLETIRARRGEDWPASIYQTQLERLNNAFASATVTVDTSKNSIETTLEIVLRFLRNLTKA